VDYKGTAKLTPIYSKVNATNFTFIYRCQDCLIFDDPTQPSFNTSTSQGTFEQGWAQSSVFPADRTNPDSSVVQHNNGMGEFQITVSKAANAAYAKWAGTSSTAPTSPTPVAPSGNSTATIAAPSGTTVVSVAAPTATAAATPTTFKGVPVPAATSYDYVVVGGGAAGIPMADRLSAAGYSVLLIEKGVASSARWGGSKFCLSVIQTKTNLF
jgi:cellobiose dehydrogenase (acceptor)